MHILLDPQNKSVPEFFIYRKIQDGRQWSKVQNRPNLTPQITFRLGIWFPFIRFWLNLVWTYYLTLQTSLRNNLALIAKCKMAGGRGQRSKIIQIWRHKSHFGWAFESRLSDLDTIWHEHTSCPYKPVCTRIYQLGQYQRFLLEVKGPKSSKFHPTNHILALHFDLVHQIWTQFGMNILLAPTNQFAQEFTS